MTKTPQENTVAVVKRNGKVVGYLTHEAVQDGLDIQLDMNGYEIVAL